MADLNLKLSERHIYSSSCFGILAEEIDVDNENDGPAEGEEITLISYYRGYRQYELSNHLGNVLATVSDKKFAIDSNDDEEIDYFEPEIITASDYYPFGMLMPGRGGSLINGQWQESGPEILVNLSVDDRTGNQPSEYIALESIEFLPGFESGNADEFVAYITTSGNGGSYEGVDGLYRYGFNGKEMDNEVKGAGNQLDFGARIYDPRTGKFFSMDPLSRKFPWESPFAFAENEPINNIDLEGLQRGGNRYANPRPTTPRISINTVNRSFQRKQSKFQKGSNFINTSIYNSTVLRSNIFLPPPEISRERGIIGPFIFRSLNENTIRVISSLNNASDLWEYRESILNTISGAIYLLNTEEIQQTTGIFTLPISRTIITSITFMDAESQAAFDLLQGQYERKFAEIEKKYTPTPLNAPFVDPNCSICLVSSNQASIEMIRERINQNNEKAKQKFWEILKLGKSPAELLLQNVKENSREFTTSDIEIGQPTISNR